MTKPTETSESTRPPAPRTQRRVKYDYWLAGLLALVMAGLVVTGVAVECEQRSIFVALIAFAGAAAFGIAGRAIQLSGKLPGVFGDSESLTFSVVGAAALFLILLFSVGRVLFGLEWQSCSYGFVVRVCDQLDEEKVMDAATISVWKGGSEQKLDANGLGEARFELPGSRAGHTFDIQISSDGYKKLTRRGAVLPKREETLPICVVPVPQAAVATPIVPDPVVPTPPTCQKIKSIRELGWRSGHKTKFCTNHEEKYDGVYNPFGDYGAGGFCFKGDSQACIAEIQKLR